MNENNIGEGRNISFQNEPILTDMQRDILGEIGNICMSSSATTLHDILGRRVTITTPNVSVISINELTLKYNAPYVIADVSYTEGVLGKSVLIIKTEDVKLITSIMLGEEVSDLKGDLSELHLSAIGEVMNQMMGASSTTLATLILRRVNISPPNISVVNISEDSSKFELQDNVIISIKFSMVVEDLLNTEISLLIPFDFGKNLIEEFLKVNHIDDKDSKESEPKSFSKQQHSPSTNVEKQSNVNINSSSENLIKQIDGKQDNIKKVEFQSFDTEDNIKNQTNNMDLLLDIPLNITVELGKTKKYLKDILELNVGSIVSLEKPAGDLVDVLVNGKLIAKGEVVVIDDNFGVRITDIVMSNIRFNYAKKFMFSGDR